MLNDLEAWLKIRQNQNQSEHTISAYRRDVRAFLAFCETRDLALSDIEASDLREFLAHQINTYRLSSSSLQRQLSAIRQFMKWLKENLYLNHNVSEDFRFKRQSRPLPGMIDIETVIQILDQPEPETNKALWIRDKALLELLYSNGLRLAEVQALTFTDIDFSRKLLRVIGKGNKTRILPFGEKAKNALLNWLKIYKHWVENIEPESPIFISQYGQALTPRQIENRVKFQAQRAGVNVNLYPHLLRHCFASHLLSASGDLRAVQEMLGHNSLSTTQIYTHLDFEHLATVYDQAHPRASSVK